MPILGDISAHQAEIVDVEGLKGFPVNSCNESIFNLSHPNHLREGCLPSVIFAFYHLVSHAHRILYHKAV